MIENPLLLSIPRELHTPRLELVAVRSGDGERLMPAVSESLEQLRLYPAFMPWATREQSPEAVESFCRTAEAAFISRTSLSYLVIERASALGSERVIGCCGVHQLNWANHAGQLGYWRRPSAAGHGVMIEAVKALRLLSFEVLAMRRLEIVADARNEPSRRTAERAGFELEAVRRSDRVEAGDVLVDSAVYVAFSAS